MAVALGILAVHMTLGIFGWGWLNFIIRGGSSKTSLRHGDLRWLRIQFLVAIVAGFLAPLVCLIMAEVEDMRFGLCFRFH